MIDSLEIEGRSPGFDRFDLDSVAAIIFTDAGRYLLQHRENRPAVSYPNSWSLFGGARERGERAEDAIRRELLEELEFPVRECRPFLGCTYELWFENRLSRKIFFSIHMTEAESRSLVLREGQGMAWLLLREIYDRGDAIVPYDLGMIALHSSRRALDHT
jgi:8-oxo-dGTP pyrophosphatase MutT (NUDIX family)